MTIKWLDNAREDMLSLFAWYEKKSLSAAVKLYNGIINDVDRLTNNPYMGRIEPLLEGLEYEFRTIVTSSRNYKVIYFIADDKIMISRVWDCRQNPSRLRRAILKRQK